MALLPEKLRYRFFDRISLQTMRYVDTIPLQDARGKLKAMYEQINRDFFINGSLTSRSRVEPLFAAAWVLGRETILVDDRVGRTTKEALAALLSSINDCPYCGDMLVSLIHAGERSEDAMKILDQQPQHISDPLLRRQLAWAEAAVTAAEDLPPCPFTREQLPEVLGSLMAMSDVNRFSHIVMAGSPVKAPFGSATLKKSALKVFGNELKASHAQALIKGDSLKFLPPAPLPDDMGWARPNPRVAAAIARWCATTEQQAEGLIPAGLRQRIHANLSRWDGKPMALGRYWVEDEIRGLGGRERDIARFILLLAKAAYQIDAAMHEHLLEVAGSQEDFIRILAWGSYISARYLARRIAAAVPAEPQREAAA